MKKGQTEIMGLMVIVILLVVIGSFALVFSVRKNNNSQDITQSVEVGNFLSSMMKFTPCLEDEERTSLEVIIKNCYKDKVDYCNENCKDYIEDVVDDVLSHEVNKTKGTYLFEINDENNNFLQVGKCTGSRRDTDKYPIQVGSSSLLVKLWICRQ